ncbi:hypothetical protein PIB30_075367, partial [Stylosanthes scabra]|nr:hypothetical protein [Stylosanthes scabra]
MQFKHQDHILRLRSPITRRKELSKEFSSSYLHNWHVYDENDESNEWPLTEWRSELR